MMPRGVDPLCRYQSTLFGGLIGSHRHETGPTAPAHIVKNKPKTAALSVQKKNAFVVETLDRLCFKEKTRRQTSGNENRQFQPVGIRFDPLLLTRNGAPPGKEDQSVATLTTDFLQTSSDQNHPRPSDFSIPRFKENLSVILQTVFCSYSRHTTTSGTCQK